MSKPPREPQCLIVADSEVLIRNALADYLRQCGYKVIDASTSDEVVSVIEVGSAEVCAVLIDAQIDGSLNAFALRMWLRERAAHIDVILAGDVESAAKAAGNLCDDGPHLKRPYDPQAVLAHIKRLLARARK